MTVITGEGRFLDNLESDGPSACSRLSVDHWLENLRCMLGQRATFILNVRSHIPRALLCVYGLFLLMFFLLPQI